MTAEQRRFARANARWKLTATSLDNTQITGMTTNVSVGGLQFVAEGNFKKGDRFLVYLLAYVNGNTIPVKVAVEVAYVFFGGGAGANVGVKVISMSETYTKVVEAYLKTQF